MGKGGQQSKADEQDVELGQLGETLDVAVEAFALDELHGQVMLIVGKTRVHEISQAGVRAQGVCHVSLRLQVANQVCVGQAAARQYLDGVFLGGIDAQ